MGSMHVETRDGTVYKIEEKMYRQSVLLRHLCEETNVLEEGVQVLVDSDVFAKIYEFMHNHANDVEVAEDYETFDVLMTDFDREFIGAMDSILLFRVTSAANYLNMPVLLEICCKSIADSLKNKTTEEIKKYLAITENTNKKEEECAKAEYKWIE